MSKHKIEIFTADSLICQQSVDAIQSKLDCSICDVEVLDTKYPDMAERARAYGIICIPSIVLDGKVLDACLRKCTAIEELEGLGVCLTSECASGSTCC